MYQVLVLTAQAVLRLERGQTDKTNSQTHLNALPTPAWVTKTWNSITVDMDAFTTLTACFTLTSRI